jgi:hypothetical protein
VLICTEIGSDIRMVGEGSLEPCNTRACVDMCGWWHRVALQALNRVLPVRERLISHIRMVAEGSLQPCIACWEKDCETVCLCQCVSVCARVRLFVCYW